MNLGATILLVLGVALDLVAALGVAVMRSAYDRLHYVCVAGFGGLFIGLSVLAQQGFSLIGDKSLAVGVILVALSPVVMHVTAQSLRTRELGDWRADVAAEESA